MSLLSESKALLRRFNEAEAIIASEYGGAVWSGGGGDASMRPRQSLPRNWQGYPRKRNVFCGFNEAEAIIASECLQFRLQLHQFVFCFNEAEAIIASE